MKTAEMIVLAYGRFCQSTRAYLTYMAHHGWRPRKIIQILAPGREPLSRMAGRIVGKRLASACIERVRFRRRYSRSFRRACQLVQQEMPVRIPYFGNFNLMDFGSPVQRVFAWHLNDPELLSILAKQPVSTMLYTSGGRVGAGFFQGCGFRLLHIHPGVVPDVRGSDGLLWSILTRGRPGASCFYMDAGIDTGEILLRKEFPFPKLPDCLRDIPTLLLSAAMVYAYDPHLRGQTLVDLLERAGDGADLSSLPEEAQSAGRGTCYFYMHPLLKRAVIESLFVRET